MTQEEFLDKKNIELIRSVKDAIDLKSELAVLTYYIGAKTKENPSLFCGVHKRKIVGVYPTYWVHELLKNIIEMMDKGELVFSDKPKIKKRIDDIFTVRQLNAIREYQRVYVDSELSCIDIYDLTIKDISDMSQHKMTRCRNVGKKTIQEIDDILKEQGLRLRG